MTQLVVPMAGLGSRFSAAGYQVSKPLLPIGEFMMFEIVISNLWHPSISKVVLISQRGAVPDGNLERIFTQLGVPIHNLEIDFVTEGPADSVSLARHLLDDQDSLVIANSDQYVDADLSTFFESLESNDRQHQILTMEADDPRWSFVELGAQGEVVRVREKEVISRFATVGIYGFATSLDFHVGLEDMRKSHDRTNGEFYVAPVYNYLGPHSETRITHLGKLGDVMHGLGVPADYEAFLKQGPVEKSLTKARQLFGGHY
jgi:NDP-sugar pyrophosphorylase family protein